MFEAITITICLTVIFGIFYYVGKTMPEGDFLENDDFNIDDEE